MSVFTAFVIFIVTWVVIGYLLKTFTNIEYFQNVPTSASDLEKAIKDISPKSAQYRTSEDVKRIRKSAGLRKVNRYIEKPEKQEILEL